MIDWIDLLLCYMYVYSPPDLESNHGELASPARPVAVDASPLCQPALLLWPPTLRPLADRKITPHLVTASISRMLI